jgi:hypothetical protein
MENPLHRYNIDYQGFNPLQTLNFSRYTPATSCVTPLPPRTDSHHAGRVDSWPGRLPASLSAETTPAKEAAASAKADLLVDRAGWERHSRGIFIVDLVKYE